MNKSIKHIFIISVLLLLMMGVVSTASADKNFDNATDFLKNISNLESNSVIEINSSLANVSSSHTILASNITIRAVNGVVTFQSKTINVPFIIKGTNVTLEGITFNGFNRTNGNGGVLVMNSTKDLILKDCIFSNNTVQYDGGVIFVNGTIDNLIMKDCLFQNNTAKIGSGGAICVLSTVGNLNMTNCRFIKNTAQNGGAISANNTRKLRQYNTTFQDNTAKQVGGAISVFSTVDNWNMTKCKFQNNTAKNGSGGAIYIGDKVGNWTQEDCQFNNNTATNGSGGAIYVHNNVTIWIQDNCTFQYNNATGSNGGAICVVSRINKLNQTDCRFIKNTAIDGGGAISLTIIGNLSQDNCTFQYNTAKNGGAIAMLSNVDNWNMTNCNFQDNNVTDGAGGAIYAEIIGNWTQKDCQFNNNTAFLKTLNWGAWGGAIYVHNRVNVWMQDNCTFQCNNATNVGGAITVDNKTGNWIMIDCHFIKNNASIAGAIYVEIKVDSCNMTNCIFQENTAKNGSGGAIHFYGTVENLNMTDCQFTNNNATNVGGAIFIRLEVNKWIQDNCTFQYNSADNGGAIYIDDSINNWKQIDCLFQDNNATNSAGAIRVDNKTGNWIMINCHFIRNTAQTAGAIYIANAGNWTQEDCQFNNNTATNGSGGAIFIDETVNNWNMTDCYFQDNIANMTREDIYIGEKGRVTFSGDSKALIYNKGIITNTLTCIIFDHKTMGVVTGQDVGLYAIIKTGNYTVFGSAFNFTTNNHDNITGNLTEGQYTANYHVTGKVGDEIIVNGSYDYAGAINYQTALLIIKNSVNLTGTNVTSQYNKRIEVKLNVTTSNGTLVKNGLVYIMIDGVKYSGQVSDGKVTVEIYCPFDVGTYYLTAVYEENYEYLNDTFDFILNVTQAEPMILLSIDDVNYGEKAIVKITTIYEMTGNLTLVINGIPHSVSTDSREYIITEKLNAGFYGVYAYYLGNNNFKFGYNLTAFTVKPINTHINVTVDNSTLDKVVLHINASDVYGNPINGSAIATITGFGSYYGVITNGVGMIVISNLPTGKYTADILFTSSSNYKESTANCTFETSSTPTGYDLTASDVYKEFENATQYHAILTDSNGNPIANKTISIAISSSKWSKDALYWITTDENGIATLMINLLPNDYIITARYGDEVSVNNITVIPSNLKLQANNLIKYFMNGSQYTVKVTDVNGNAVANRTVTISIYKSTWKSPVKYYAKTNSDGVARLDINLMAGTYSVTSSICYNSTKNSITVLPTLTASSITKKVNKAGSLKAKLVDGQGNPAIGREVTFTVGYKTYTFTTDVNGIATLPIHLHVGTWNVLVACPETGATTRATVKVTK